MAQPMFSDEQSAYDYITKNKKQLTKELDEGEVRTLFNSKDKTISIGKRFNILNTFTATYGDRDFADIINEILDLKYGT